MKKNYWVFLLIIVFLLALYVRCIPGTKLQSPRLQAIDPYFFFRMGEYFIENGNLPTHDYLAQWGSSGGPDRNKGHLVTILAYPLMYFILNPIFGISWYWVGVWIPAFFGALQVLFMYFLGKELFNSKKIGLLSAAFLAFVPGILYRVSAGFIEKEPIAGVLMVLGFYFLVKSFKVKEKEITRDLSWKYLIFHPFSIIHRTSIEDERVKTIKTIAYGIISGFFFALMAGASGLIRFPLLIIGLFVMVSLLLNTYPKIMLYSHISMFTSFYLISRVFGGIVPSFPAVEIIVNFVVMVFLVVRYLVEKFRLVKEEYLPYVIPVFFFVGLFVLGITSYVYVDVGEWVGGNMARISNPLTIGVIPSTVAESQTAGGFLRNTLSTFGTEYAVKAFQWPAFIVYLSAIYFSVLGVLLMCYEFIFKRRDLEHILIVTMFILAMVLATGAMRLAFVFAFPLSIAAGYFLIRGGKYFLGVSRKFLKGKGYHYLKITGGVFIGIVIFTNFASGWLMANGIGSSLTNDWYEALVWLKDNTPEDAVLLEWWDFGWWFHYIGKKITLVDGGYHGDTPTRDIADFYTTPFEDDSLNFLKKYEIDYVMVSPDLIPKFGAMSKIANWGAKVDVLPVFNLKNSYQEDDKTLLEYSGGGQTVLVVYSLVGEGDATIIQNITALIKMPQGQSYVRDIGVGNQIIRNDKPNSIAGMIYFAGNAVIYIPEVVEDCVFVRLYLFDGFGMENYFEKIYDKLGMKIYKVRHDNFPENITGDYINMMDRD
ncbi:MAG: STT3 domain-containing protein [Candidatus Aenigmarchaeota archaeon]